MPLIPKGLTPELFRRVLDRARSIVGPSQPAGPGLPGEPGEPRTPADPSLVERAIDWVRRRLGPAQEPEPEPEYRGPPRDLAELKARIQTAGRLRVKLYAAYQAKEAPAPRWRFIIPYSYRYRAKNKPWIPLLFAACGAHGWQTEAFRLEGFSDLQLTDRPATEGAYAQEF